MRQFIRHPSDIPIEYSAANGTAFTSDALKNVSVGGLCFGTVGPIAPGTQLRVRIKLLQPPFEALATVVWCRRSGDHFDVGVRFADENTEFRVRMVEQLCYIEHFRREILDQEGRELSGEEAAIEWIKKCAADFPR